jgi:hypothetical protein
MENGVAELTPAPRLRAEEFALSGHWIECPLGGALAQRSPEKWPDSPPPIAVDQQRWTTVYVADLLRDRAKVSVLIDVGDCGVRVRRRNTAPLVIYKELISCALVAREKGVAIVLRSCVSLRLMLPQHAELAEALARAGICVIVDSSRTASKIAELWARGRLLTFDYLLALNFLNGRFFSSSSHYPFFPVIVSRGAETVISSFVKVQTVTFANWFDGSPVDLPHMLTQPCFPPEVYGSLTLLSSASAVTHPPWASSTSLFEDNYRRSLEMPELYPQVAEWVTAQFGIERQHESVLGVSQSSGVLEERAMVDHPIAWGFVGGASYAVFVFGEGFALSAVYFRAGYKMIPITTAVYKPVALSLTVGEDFIIGFDPAEMKVCRLSPDHQFSTAPCTANITAITTYDSGSVIFVIDRHDVFITRAGDFPGNARFLFSEVERIERVVVDPTIGIVAVLRFDGRVEMISAVDGALVGTLDFKGAEVRALVITETWHLVVVECNLKIVIASVTGVILKTREIYKRLMLAITFRIGNGNDFVAYLDGEKTLGLFEAFYPEKSNTIGRL